MRGWLAVALVLLPSLCSAQTKTGTTTAQFMLIEPSARIAAMGNAGVAMQVGIQSVFYNPGALGAIDQWALQFTHSAWIADIGYNYAAIAKPIGSLGTVFLGITSLSSGDMTVRTVEQPLGTGERFSVSDLAISGGYGRRLTDRFTAGIQVNFVEETIWHSSLRTVSFNVGTVYQISETGLQLGSSLSNFGTGGGYDGRDLRIQYDNDPDRFGDNSALPGEQFTEEFSVPVLFRVGLCLPGRIDEDNSYILAIDALHPSDNTEGVNLGGEWMWRNTLGLRMGYQDLGQEDSEVGATLGAGLNGALDTYNFHVDYAWAEHGRLDGTHRMTFAVTF